MSQNDPDKNSSDKKIIKAKGGFVDDTINYVKLIIRLLADKRISPLLKLLPIGSFVYTVLPLDIPGPIDDAAVLGASMYLFITLCPQAIVDEHMLALNSTVSSVWRDVDKTEEEYKNEDIIDAEFHDKK